MEASGSAAASPADDGKASGGRRFLGLILVLALLFAGGVLIAVAIDLFDTPVGKAACERTVGCTEYFDGSKSERTIDGVLLLAAGGAAAIAALIGLFFVATGRRGSLLLRWTVIAVAAGVISIVVGRIT